MKIEFPREPRYSNPVSIIQDLWILPCFLREILLWKVTNPLKTFLIARNRVISAFIINGSSPLWVWDYLILWVTILQPLPIAVAMWSSLVRYEKIEINSKESDLWPTVPPSLQCETLKDRHWSSAGSLVWGMSRRDSTHSGEVCSRIFFSISSKLFTCLLSLFSWML